MLLGCISRGMNSMIAIDINVWAYALDVSEPLKQ